MTVKTKDILKGTLEDNYDFDVQKERDILKKQTQAIRKRSYSARKSRLDKFKFQLLQLKEVGNTIAELQRFLRNKRIKVSHSTISRWLKKNG